PNNPRLISGADNIAFPERGGERGAHSGARGPRRGDSARSRGHGAVRLLIAGKPPRDADEAVQKASVGRSERQVARGKRPLTPGVHRSGAAIENKGFHKVRSLLAIVGSER